MEYIFGENQIFRAQSSVGHGQLRMGPPNVEDSRGRNLLCELIGQRVLSCVTTIKA